VYHFLESLLTNAKNPATISKLSDFEVYNLRPACAKNASTLVTRAIQVMI
jgi:hypothetical protein